MRDKSVGADTPGRCCDPSPGRRSRMNSGLWQSAPGRQRLLCDDDTVTTVHRMQILNRHRFRTFLA